MLASLSEVNKELLADLCTTGANLNDFEPSTQDIVGTAFAVPSAYRVQADPDELSLR